MREPCFWEGEELTVKCRVKMKEGLLTVKLKLSRDETLDHGVLEAVAGLNIRGLMKPAQLKAQEAAYTGPAGVSLAERLKKPISRQDFALLTEQVIGMAQKLDSFHVSHAAILWDVRYIYINERTKELRFLCVPLTNVESHIDWGDLMEALIYMAKPQNREDAEFLSRFVGFLKERPAYRAEELEAYIAGEEGGVGKRPGRGGSGFITDKRQDYYRHYGEQAEDERETELLCDADQEDTCYRPKEKGSAEFCEAEEETGLLCETNEETCLLCEDEEETGLLTAEEADEEETGLLTEDDGDVPLSDAGAQAHYPTLYRVRTGESVSVNKPVFRVGKERSCVDYCVSGNSAVSRNHADIVTRNGHCFVVDLNSKNGTYLNEQPLPAQRETELFDECRLKLADEEFVFHTL